ncbi:MAG TPA: PEP-CTERM sorting domain-containing protein [Pyrinomonadaceae bacterium]
MPRKLAAALASLGLLLLLSAGAKADTIVITGGTATILDPPGSTIGSFNLLAAGFSATGRGDRNSATGLTGIRGSSDFFGSVVNNGTVMSGVFNHSTVLNFTLAPYSIPDPGIESDSAFVSTAFTMIGNLTLVARAPGQPVLFSMGVSGSGIAEITYARLGPGGIFLPTVITYVFNAAEPVPEPATLMLLGAGLAGVVARVRRRRTNV